MRERDVVESLLQGWSEERNRLQERLARVRAEERRESHPGTRVQLAREVADLQAQLAIVDAEVQPLRDELSALDDRDASRLKAGESLAGKGKKAFASLLKTVDTLESQVSASLALEAEARTVGVYQAWPSVPPGLVRGLAQARRELALVESVSRAREELLESRKGKQADGDQDQDAVGRWAQLRDSLP